MRRTNERGGVLGHKLQLIVRDDKATPTVGVAQARDLVLSGQVKFLAGTCSSAVGKSVEQLVANPSHVIYALGVSDPTVFSAGPEIYAFNTIPTAQIEGRNAAAYIRAHPQWKRIAVMSEDYSYGYQVTAAFRQAMRGSGQTIISQDYLPSGGSDYTPYIDKVLAERPDAVYSTVITEDTVTLVKQGLPLGLFDKTNFFGIMDYATIDAMPQPPVGVAGYTFYPSSSIYHTPFARELEALSPAVANGGAAGDAFNQIQLIVQGIEKATLDRSDEGPRCAGRRDGADGPGAMSKSTSATTRWRCRSRWARSWGPTTGWRLRTSNRCGSWTRTSTSNAELSEGGV